METKKYSTRFLEKTASKKYWIQLISFKKKIFFIKWYNSITTLCTLKTSAYQCIQKHDLKMRIFISITFETLIESFLDSSRVDSYFFHTYLTALFKFWYNCALVLNIFDPSPPFLRLFLKDNHLSNLLCENILPISTFFISITITAILVSKVAVLFFAMKTRLTMINDF